VIQGSSEWHELRCGKFTGSRFADLMAMTKSGPSTSRANLIMTLALERLTGTPEEGFQNDAMRRGTELEPLARGAYEAHTGELVEQVPFVVHPDFPYVGVSPDGLLGDDGMEEDQQAQANTLLAGVLTANAARLSEPTLKQAERRLYGLSDAIARRYFLQGAEPLRAAGMTLA